MLQNPIIRFANTLLRRNVWFVVVFQGFLIACSLLCAWLLRFDFSLPYRNLLFLAVPVLLTIRLLCIAYFRLLHGWWQYVGISDLLDIAKAVASGSVLFFAILRYGLGLKEFPKSIYISEAILTACLLAGVRLASRIIAESVRQDLSAAKKVIVIGAGAAAQMVIRELKQPGSGYNVIACLDDDSTKTGSKVQGIPVVGSVDQLPHLFKGEQGECQIIIAIPSATGEQMRRFVALAGQAGMKYLTTPALRDLITGEVLLSQIREVSLDDLLGREPVTVDLEAVREKVADKVVLITGAAGSIGSELCRQLFRFDPKEIVCLDQNENGIFCLQIETKQQGSVAAFCVADIRDRQRLRTILFEHSVEIIFHAAAYKHVPLMEGNVNEAVQNNIFGLLNILEVAEEVGCRDLILISSDKAVNPTSIMGVTKRICELILASRPSNGLRCTSVRFGNVLGSSGSVVPILQEQLHRNLPLTITHPEIERFFMTIHEAVSLILQAFTIGSHGDVLVLDMGKPVRILDLAKNLIRLAAKSEDEVDICFTGLRPGEKLAEELFYPSETVFSTLHPKIKRTRGNSMIWSQLIYIIEQLRDIVATGSVEEIVMTIKQIVPEYCSQYDGYEHLTTSTPQRNDSAMADVDD